MMSKLAAVTNAALRQRWSTVALLALILTVNRAVLDWELVHADLATYIAKVFVTLLLSVIVSLAIHVLLYLIFSPKQH